MKFGLVITNQSWVDAQALVAIDGSRFETLNVVDHPAFPIPDPWTWLAYAAARTRHIRLGTHVTGAPFHHPQNLARQVATVDVLSGGRAALGIGTGYEHGDFEPYGYAMPPFRDRVKLLEESVTVMKSLWSEEETSFEGAHFRLQGAKFAPKPVQRPGPPILVGLNTAGMALRAAVRCADGLNTWQLGPAQLAALFEAARAECVAAGREAESFALTSDVIFLRGATEAQADEAAGRIAEMAIGWGRSRATSQWDASGTLFGDASSMIEQARAFAELGVSELSLAMSNIEDIVWFNEKVIPLCS